MSIIKKPFRKKKDRAASDVLEEAVRVENGASDLVSAGELMQALHERGFGLLLVIFALPNCVPIPLPPGFSSLFAIPLLFLAIQMIIGMNSPWLPNWLKNRTIRRSRLASMVSRAAPRLKKVEKLLRPRFSFASSTSGERIIGIFATLFALSIAVPLPWTNFIPGIGILVMALGLLSKDGITILIGIFIGLVGLSITSMVILFGVKVVIAIMPWAG